MRLNSTRESLEQRLVHHVGAEHAQLLLNSNLVCLNNQKLSDVSLDVFQRWIEAIENLQFR
jgi:hypothetical protein